jgi:predicted Zn-dependent peptidase
MKINYSIHKVNGYTVILVPNDTNVVYIKACIKTGSLNESKHDAGIHHLVEHILTEAWKPCGKDTCNSYWDKKGVNMNASTNSSYMHFYVNGLVEDMEEMMQYMIDIITKPFLQESTLKIEKHAVLNELLTRLNNPESKLYDAFNKEFFIQSYSADYDLQIKNLKHMNMKRIRDFYNKINKEIIFVISGPKKMPNFKETHHFKKPREDFFSYSNKIIYVPQKQKSTILVMGMPIICNDTYKMNACINVLHMIFFQLLRIEMKLIYSLSISLSDVPAPYIFIKSTIENKHTSLVYKTIVETIGKYTKESFPQEFIDGMKKKHKIHYESLNYTSSFMANYVLDEYLEGKVHSIEKHYKDIDNMNQKDFMKIMKMIHKSLDHCVVAYQGPIKVL